MRPVRMMARVYLTKSHKKFRIKELMRTNSRMRPKKTSHSLSKIQDPRMMISLKIKIRKRMSHQTSQSKTLIKTKITLLHKIKMRAKTQKIQFKMRVPLNKPQTRMTIKLKNSHSKIPTQSKLKISSLLKLPQAILFKSQLNWTCRW